MLGYHYPEAEYDYIGKNVEALMLSCNSLTSVLLCRRGSLTDQASQNRTLHLNFLSADVYDILKLP